MLEAKGGHISRRFGTVASVFIFCTYIHTYSHTHTPHSIQTRTVSPSCKNPRTSQHHPSPSTHISITPPEPNSPAKSLPNPPRPRQLSAKSRHRHSLLPHHQRKTPLSINAALEDDAFIHSFIGQQCNQTGREGRTVRGGPTSGYICGPLRLACDLVSARPPRRGS